MDEIRRTRFTWQGAAENLRRLAQANRRAEEQWLQSLSVEEAIEIFEDLSKGIPELDRVTVPDDHPVPLFKLWRR